MDGSLVRWMVGWMAGWMVWGLVCWMVDWMVRWFAGSLDGWLGSRVVGRSGKVRYMIIANLPKHDPCMKLCSSSILIG